MGPENLVKFANQFNRILAEKPIRAQCLLST